MPRGISTPNRVSGPDRLHRMSVKDTSDTIEDTAPSARVWEMLA